MHKEPAFGPRPQLEPRDVFRPEDIAAAIAELRRQRGWTQALLAEWLGVTRPTVARLESTGAVNISTAVRALTLLGATATIHLKTERLVADVRDDR